MATSNQDPATANLIQPSVASTSDPRDEARDRVFAEFGLRDRESPKPTTTPRAPIPDSPRLVLAAFPSPSRSRTFAAPATESDQTSRWSRMFVAGCLLIAAAFAYRALPWSWRAAINPLAISRAAGGHAEQPERASRQKRLVTKSIEDVLVGDRMVGRNPIREQAEGTEPDPATWRKISLFIRKDTGSGLWIDLLRPSEWIEEHDARTGGTIFLDLPEIGAVGNAEVTHLGPCPPIQPGDGTIVTGTFKHQADEYSRLIELRLEGQPEPTGVTESHAYWSVDRQAFVEVGKLDRGELVDTVHGPRRVLSIEPMEYSGFLFNLETTEHVYRVGSLGTLVHNSCVIHGRPHNTSLAHAKAMNDMANRMAKSGAYSDVYMHSKWTTILRGKGVKVSPNQLPDVAGVRTDGKIDIIEFASSKRDHQYGNLLGRNRDIWNQLPEHLRGDILVYDEVGNWTHVFS
jgi:hypothetical protein